VVQALGFKNNPASATLTDLDRVAVFSTTGGKDVMGVRFSFTPTGAANSGQKLQIHILHTDGQGDTWQPASADDSRIVELFAKEAVQTLLSRSALEKMFGGEPSYDLRLQSVTFATSIAQKFGLLACQ
jgi:hypothetical protein